MTPFVVIIPLSSVGLENAPHSSSPLTPPTPSGGGRSGVVSFFVGRGRCYSFRSALSVRPSAVPPSAVLQPLNKNSSGDCSSCQSEAAAPRDCLPAQCLPYLTHSVASRTRIRSYRSLCSREGRRATYTSTTGGEIPRAMSAASRHSGIVGQRKNSR